MKLDLINKQKEDFKNAIVLGTVKPDYLTRLSILKWQENFDIEEMYLGPIIEKSLKNDISGRLWGGENHSIKSGLIALANQNPDLFWSSLKDLFNNERMIIMKANRFLHHCDVIQAEIHKKDQKSNTHFQNYYSASLLLTLQYPNEYCLFDFAKFEVFGKKIGINDMPVDTDLERYYKIIRAVLKIIEKDAEFMEAYYSKLEEGIFLGPCLSIVFDLIEYSNE